VRDVVVVLSNIRSLYNVGAFFRTADGAGVQKIICCGITGTPKNRRLWKVSLGAEQSVDWEYIEETVIAIEQLRTQQYQIVGVELTPTSQLYTDIIYDQKVALVFGAEVEGISSDILALCDVIAQLPMRGQKESLNVSIVGGVMMYSLLQ
jgi:tRNA G18 (ribose-2'-O)-methylase SpoU